MKHPVKELTHIREYTQQNKLTHSSREGRYGFLLILVGKVVYDLIFQGGWDNPSNASSLACFDFKMRV